eukprot:8324199-Pyramimonas_sp.AAC.1
MNISCLFILSVLVRRLARIQHPLSLLLARPDLPCSLLDELETLACASQASKPKSLMDAAWLGARERREFTVQAL